MGTRAGILALLLVGGCQAPSEASPPPSEDETVRSAASSAPEPPPEVRAKTSRGGGAADPRTDSAPEAPPPSLPMLGCDRTQDQILALLEQAPAHRFEPVGKTSVVFRMALRGEVDAAFKPRTRQHPRGHRAEVAAYRLARLLALDNVPPAVTRRVSARKLRARLDTDFADAWDEIVRWTAWDEDGLVPGAAIYWVPGARDLGLDRPHQTRRLRRWLSQERQFPEERAALVSDASTMLAFDYLIGNWDRWRRGRVSGPPSGQRLFIRDHHVAFAVPWPDALHRRVRDRMLDAQRFSRRFVERLARMGDRDLREALKEDPGHAAGAPILSDAQIAGFMDRRAALLTHVGSLIQAYGEDRVLAFP